MFLVSFPCLFVLNVTDNRLLTWSLSTVQAEGAIHISETAATHVARRWQDRFRIINLCSSAIGIAIGLVVAYLNYVTYLPKAVGYWIANNGHLILMGYVYLYGVLFFYAVTTTYVIRNISISFLIRDVVGQAELHMLPLHPDKCGGLRPVGQLGLRNQYVLTLLGVNLAILVFVSHHYLKIISPALLELIMLAAVAYVILGPLVFLGPLLPFRAGMLRAKVELVGEVARRLRVELGKLRSQVRSGYIAKEDEELIERLRKLGAIFDELPVWPFDAATLRRFLTAYVTPLVTGGLYPLVIALLEGRHLFFQHL